MSRPAEVMQPQQWQQAGPATMELEFSHPVFSLALTNFKSGDANDIRIAVGSMTLQKENIISILKVQKVQPQGQPHFQQAPVEQLNVETRFAHEYPPTKLIWSPQQMQMELLASSARSV